ncbi:hypothetical protein FRB97_008382 [Tulasnella sp. 331]|nr:hypothetical protein FRB97_008382 [Tulasnella sp. 331]
MLSTPLFLALLSLSAVFGLRIPSPTPIDGVHVPLASANATVTDPFQWWYFDLLSDTDLSSIQVVYYSGYGFGPIINHPYYVQLSGTFPNGTAWEDIFVPATDLATVTKSASLPLEASNGVWPGAGGWTSSGKIADQAKYIATFTGAAFDISGNLTLQQTAPSHYPCNDARDPDITSGVNLVGPGLGWSNVIPGAQASASFQFNGQLFTVSGTGYHDSNFGHGFLQATVATWYWGRGTVGSYTFVYFAYLPKGSNITTTSDPSTWYTSGYLVDASSPTPVPTNFCSAEQTAAAHSTNFITITTTGEVWQQGPSGPGMVKPGVAESVQVVYHIGAQSYAFNLTSQSLVIASVPLSYDRWTASVGMVGSTANGKGMFELFNPNGP